MKGAGVIDKDGETDWVFSPPGEVSSSLSDMACEKYLTKVVVLKCF